MLAQSMTGRCAKPSELDLAIARSCWGDALPVAGALLSPALGITSLRVAPGNPASLASENLDPLHPASGLAMAAKGEEEEEEEEGGDGFEEDDEDDEDEEFDGDDEFEEDDDEFFDGDDDDDEFDGDADDEDDEDEDF